MVDKVKFGIIGAGAIAAMHAEALKATANAELVAVYDKVAKQAQVFADKYQVQAMDSFEDFLSNKDIEAVTIATPTGMHSLVAIPAACAGKHILCEKPLDVTLEKADAIIKACDENNVILSAVFQARFGDNVQLIKKAIDSGRLGRVVLANARLPWFRSQEYYKSSSWRGTWALDGGGALMNQAIHIIDLLIYLNGDPAEVYGYTGTMTHTEIEVEDNASAVVKFKNGSLGTIEASTSCAPGFPRQVEICGSKGSIILEDDKIVRWQFEDDRPEDAQIRSNGIIGEGMHGASADPQAITCEGHRRQITDMAEAILNHTQPKLPGRDGRRAIQLICGIYESARTNKKVKFD